MKAAALLATCLTLGLTACQHAARHNGPAATVDASAPLVPGAADNSRSLILGLPAGHSSTCGRWCVEVTEDATLHVSRLEASGRTTVSPGDWKAQEGAFAFIDSDERVWAYDGQHNLFLLVSTGKTLASYGLRTLPCAVPQEVAERLTAKPDNRSSGRREGAAGAGLIE
jgi:hypothetical protein